LFQPSQYDRLTLAERLRTEGGRRAAGLGIALLLETLLLLLLLTLGDGANQGKKDGTVLTTFDAREAEEAPQPEEKPPQPRQATQPVAQPQPQPDQPQPPVPPKPAPAPPLIQLPRDNGPTFDISKLPSEPAKPAPARPQVGPPAPSSRGDTPIVGTAPNGQPLYAAQWYREPTDQELGGYLSTAQGPGWGLIACKTAPEYRVEDCVLLGEYPDGSNIGRATLAASWQFKVRPPRKGNRYLVGEWVRIRITYQMRQAPDYASK
jgi:protein TonB